jgi:hypothetical protein
MTRSNPIQFSAGQRVTLPFRARWAYIDNPTGNTVYVTEGNTSIPANQEEADWWVPALRPLAMPCNSAVFGLGLGPPFSAQQAGLPTRALAIFGDESEPMPSTGSNAALSTIVAGTVTTVPSGTQNVTGTVTSIPPGATLLDSRSFASAGAKTYNVAIAPGTQAVILEIGSNTHGLFSDLTVVGQQTGIVYYGGKTAPLSDELPIYMPIVVPIYSPSDTGVTIQFTYNSATGSTWLVYALAGDAPPTLGAGGALMVREHPPAAVARLQIILAAPAAGVLLGELTGFPAGDYQLEADLSGDGAAGSRVLLLHTDSANGTKFVTQLAEPGNIAPRWTRFVMAKDDKVRVVSDTGHALGSAVRGDVRMYRLA